MTDDERKDAIKAMLPRLAADLDKILASYSPHEPIPFAVFVFPRGHGVFVHSRHNTDQLMRSVVRVAEGGKMYHEIFTPIGRLLD